MTATDAIVREVAHVRRREARAPEIIILGEPPWWLYDPDDYPGFTVAEIAAGLTARPVEEAHDGR